MIGFGREPEPVEEAILITVPGTLVEQWRMELHRFLLPKSFDIFVYPKTKAQRVEFWSPNGPWHQSKHKPSDKILLVPHSVSSPSEFGGLCPPPA